MNTENVTFHWDYLWHYPETPLKLFHAETFETVGLLATYHHIFLSQWRTTPFYLDLSKWDLRGTICKKAVFFKSELKSLFMNSWSMWGNTLRFKKIKEKRLTVEYPQCWSVYQMIIISSGIGTDYQLSSRHCFTVLQGEWDRNISKSFFISRLSLKEMSSWDHSHPLFLFRLIFV